MQVTEQFVFWSTLPRHYLFNVQILNDNVYFDMKKQNAQNKQESIYFKQGDVFAHILKYFIRQ